MEENMEELLENQVLSPSSPHTPIESSGEHKQERDMGLSEEEEVGTFELEESRKITSVLETNGE